MRDNHSYFEFMNTQSPLLEKELEERKRDTLHETVSPRHIPATSIANKETWHARFFEIKYSRDSMQTVKREKQKNNNNAVGETRPANDISLLGKKFILLAWILVGSSTRGKGGLSNLHVTCCCLIISDQ